MSAEDLLELVQRACTDVEADDGLVAKIADALDGLSFDSLAKVYGYGDGVFNKHPPERAHVTEFVDALIGVAAAGLVDDPPTRGAIVALARIISESLAKSTRAGDRESDDATTTKAYKELRRLHGRTIRLSRQCQFVGAAYRTVLKHGFADLVPSLKAVKLYGCANRGRRDVGGGLSFEVEGEAKDAGTQTIQQCHLLTADVCFGLLAAKSVTVKKEAFGGKDEGWITPPGKTAQVRVLWTLESCEELIQALQTSSLTEPAPYIRMMDRVITRVLDRFSSLRTHPDACTTQIISQDAAMFHTDPEYRKRSRDEVDEEDATTEVSSVASSAGHSGHSARGANAYCQAWLTSGACRKDDCPFLHHVSARGALQGGGNGSRRGGRGGGPRNGGGSQRASPSWGEEWYSSPPAWAWGGGWGGGGGGGGRGGGGRERGGGGGKGKGGGKGQKGGNWW
jgi:hypothetical protein